MHRFVELNIQQQGGKQRTSTIKITVNFTVYRVIDIFEALSDYAQKTFFVSISEGVDTCSLFKAFRIGVDSRLRGHMSHITAGLRNPDLANNKAAAQEARKSRTLTCSTKWIALLPW
jgi:hypothetical protein